MQFALSSTLDWRQCNLDFKKNNKKQNTEWNGQISPQFVLYWILQTEQDALQSRHVDWCSYISQQERVKSQRICTLLHRMFHMQCAHIFTLVYLLIVAHICTLHMGSCMYVCVLCTMGIFALLTRERFQQLQLKNVICLPCCCCCLYCCLYCCLRPCCKFAIVPRQCCCCRLALDSALTRERFQQFTAKECLSVFGCI